MINSMPPTEQIKTKEKYQTVVITLSDGSVHQFTGKVATKRGDTRTVTDIRFTDPAKLPNDVNWGELK
jgi:hypothetical protein